MSRKHYVAFAKAIRERVEESNRPSGQDYELKMRAETAANIIISVCKSDNYRFNVSRFRAACGLN